MQVRRALLALVLLVTGAVTARADDVRPASLDVREATGGRFEARLRTPLRGGARLKVRARLPEGAVVDTGSFERSVAGDSLVERFVFTAEPGLSGLEIGVDGPGLASRGALLRIRLRDGRTLRLMLSVTRPTVRVEPPGQDVRAPWTQRAATSARSGLLHGVTRPAHLLLACALALAAASGGWLLALVGFLLAHIVGALLGPAPALTPELGEAALALVAMLAAREALAGSARRVVLLAALGGLVHGLGAQASDPVATVSAAFGLDLAHVCVGAGLLLVLYLARRAMLRRAAAWCAGVLAVAVAVGAAVRTDAAPEQPVLPLALTSDEASPEGPQAPAQGLQTDIEAYLDVGVFDTRVEILGRLEAVARWLGFEVPETIPVAAQDTLLAHIADTAKARMAVTIDGKAASPDAVRRGFAEQVATGTYLRDEPVEETRATALVGVVYTFRSPAIPKEVQVAWKALPAGLSEMRSRVIDPELSRDVRLRSKAPVIEWRNVLTEDPLPSVEAVAVRRSPVPLPLLSLGVLGLLALAGFGLRRRFRAAFSTGVRIGLALALLAAPVLALDVPAWATDDAAPTPGQARAITRALVENTYFALNIRDESVVYDRLALSLVEPVLTAAFEANRKALTFEQAGGARSYINAVELLGLEDVTPVAGGGFTASARWSVAGSVTHFGHRHFRRNLYTARLGLEPSGDAWTIHEFEVEDVERTR